MSVSSGDTEQQEQYLLGVVFDMGVMGIAWAMCADWLARGILLTLRWRGGAWKEKRVV